MSDFKRSSELKKDALKQLKGNWLTAIMACFIVFFVPVILGIIPFGGIVTFFISGPLAFGSSLFFINFAKGKNPQFEMLASGFNSFFSNFLLLLIKSIYIFLWSLLLVIPGIVKTYSYYLTYFIKAENPHMSAAEAIDASMKMMQGHKWRLFCLHFSFIGWFILSMITFGLGTIWLVPYMEVSDANFYLDLKEKTLQEEEVLEAEVIN